MMEPDPPPPSCKVRRTKTNAAVRRLVWGEKKGFILMVDDVPGICDVVRFILEKEGYEVRCAENGHEAVVLAYRLRPDLILLNFLMPVMDGYTALCHLKGRPILSCIKVVMHTANGNTASFQSFRDDVINKGALDCILVPFDRETILKVVKKALQPGPSPPG